jgi:very-short-patch-repair endonuclease
MKKYLMHSNQDFIGRRRELRNNQTSEEQKLWYYLRKSQLGYKFQRQHSIGPYIVDFYCFKKRLIVELDGAQHLDAQEYDQERTNYLETLGFRVVRFWNSDIKKNLHTVIEQILKYLD